MKVRITGGPKAKFLRKGVWMRTQCGMEILWPDFQPFWAQSHAKFAKWQPTGHIWPLDMLNLAWVAFLKSYNWKYGEFFFLICIFGLFRSRFVLPDAKIDRSGATLSTLDGTHVTWRQVQPKYIVFEVPISGPQVLVSCCSANPLNLPLRS